LLIKYFTVFTCELVIIIIIIIILQLVLIIIIITVIIRIIIVIIGATGTISKSLRQYLRNIQGKREIKELQKSAILRTAHRLLAVLM
jgi:hypothetical protein